MGASIIVPKSAGKAFFYGTAFLNAHYGRGKIYLIL